MRIPHSLTEDVGVGPGSEVSLRVLEGKLIVNPELAARLKLEDLLQTLLKKIFIHRWMLER